MFPPSMTTKQPLMVVSCNSSFYKKKGTMRSIGVDAVQFLGIEIVCSSFPVYRPIKAQNCVP